jgi:hypothetical protein
MQPRQSIILCGSGTIGRNMILGVDIWSVLVALVEVFRLLRKITSRLAHFPDHLPDHFIGLTHHPPLC